MVKSQRFLVAAVRVAAATFLLGIAVRANATVLINPSLEQPALAANTQQLVTPTGWTFQTYYKADGVTPNGAMYVCNGTTITDWFGDPVGSPLPNGQQAAQFNYGHLWQNTGTLVQPGYTYTLSFSVASYDNGNLLLTLLAADDATSEGTAIFGDQSWPIAAHSPWLQFSVSATYSGPTGKYLSVRAGCNGGWQAMDAISLTSARPGDFDGDGDVDGADFVAWQTNFPKASGATPADGDADTDGDVDGADFVVWQTNFPFTPSPGVTSIPEPTAGFLAVIAAAGFVQVRSRLGARKAVK